jgi:hypothetical protein
MLHRKNPPLGRAWPPGSHASRLDQRPARGEHGFEIGAPRVGPEPDL